MHRFTLIILIGLFSGSNTALAAGGGEATASDVSERRPVDPMSVAVRDSSRALGQGPWRIRRAKSPLGSIVLLRNETAAPLLVSFAAEDEPVPPGGTVAQRCDVGRGSYPLAVASERGESLLDTQLKCGDSVVVQSANDLTPSVRLEAINEAWALPPSESAAEPRDMAAGEH